MIKVLTYVNVFVRFFRIALVHFLYLKMRFLSEEMNLVQIPVNTGYASIYDEAGFTFCTFRCELMVGIKNYSFVVQFLFRFGSVKLRYPIFQNIELGQEIKSPKSEV